jgi:hypothetical protein
MRKSDKIFRNSEFSIGDMDGSVLKPVAPPQFPAKRWLMTVGTLRSVLDRECICIGQVCCGLQVVTAGMGLFQFCNSYLVRGAARYSKKLRMPLAGRLEGQL